MRAFIVADVHGYYDEMIDALNKKGFDINNPNHIFVSLGDLIDRGPKVKECLEFVNNLPNNRKILIKGNHEYLMEDLINRGFPYTHDSHNGTVGTIYQLCYKNGEDYDELSLFINRMKENILWCAYITSCIDYWENNKYIFVHGWIPCDYTQNYNYQGDFKPLTDWHLGDWRFASWINGMLAWSEGIKIENKTIYCGHWNSSYGHSKLHNDGNEFTPDWIYVWNELHPNDKLNSGVNHKPFIDKGIVAMDASTPISGFVNCRTINIKRGDIK